MAGCPKCGNADVQIMELLATWKEIEELKDLLKNRPVQHLTVREVQDTKPVGFTAPLMPVASVPEKPEPCVIKPLTAEEKTWKERYDKIKAAYVQTRLDVSGSFGNWSGDTRKRVLEHEISSELGFII